MALVICPECGTKISQHAAQCPSCGVPLMPLSDEEVAEGVKQVKAARRHDLKWWAIAAGCFVLYLIIFGPANAKRAEEEERADTYKWIQEQKQKEQDQRQKDALRAFTR